MNVGAPAPSKKEALEFRAQRPSRRLYVVVSLALIVALAWGAYQHWLRDEAALEMQRQTVNFVPTLRVAVAQAQEGPLPLSLPGSVLPFDQARIYARATGYVAERRVDIGSRVRQGELLLRIAAPDLDHQLAEAQARLGQMQGALEQARAGLQQARSDASLAEATNARTAQLADRGWETKQNADNTRLGLASKQAAVTNAEAGIKVAEANIKAQQATVQRLLQLTDFEKVEAPFSGVITARNVDNGDLCRADDSSGATPLFTLQRDDVVRVQVNVPQSGAVGLRDGLPAKVHVPELPNRIFEGKVARNAAALDAASRTMLVEVDVPNPEGALRSGLYVMVDFAVPRPVPTVVVPAESLLFNADGLRVAVVDESERVHLREVSVYRDYGTTLELRDGLKGGERVALTPPADIADGQQVKVAVPPGDAKSAAK